MGWISDFVSDPIGTTLDTAGDVVQGAGDIVSGGVGAIRDVTGGLAGGIEDVTGLNLSDPATIAALGLAAYGYYDPEAFGLAASGAEAGNEFALASAAPEAAAPEALTASSMGQASNILPATASSGTGLQATGSLGATGTASTYGGLGSEIGYGAGGTGSIAAPTEGFFAGATPTAAPSTFSLSDLGSSIATGAKDLGIGLNLPTAMVGSSLYDMYAKKQMAKQLQERQAQQQNAVNNFYSPSSPEYGTLVEQMKRQAVAAGRPTDSAQFASSIAAAIADKKMNAQNSLASGQNQLLASQLGNQYGGLNTLFNNMAMYTMLQKKGLA